VDLRGSTSFLPIGAYQSDRCEVTSSVGIHGRTRRPAIGKVRSLPVFDTLTGTGQKRRRYNIIGWVGFYLRATTSRAKKLDADRQCTRYSAKGIQAASGTTGPGRRLSGSVNGSNNDARNSNDLSTQKRVVAIVLGLLA